MTKHLQISKKLSLPLDFTTKTAAILAQRRKGKTYTASVLAEEMVAAKQPFVALDPTGAWWGLRASSDGQSAGLPVIVLGGQHGDVPLERTGGKLVADLVVDEPGYYVIDFSLFESGEAERQFAVDFAERLYRAKGQPGKDFPLHLFVDEADRFVPQNMRKGSTETSPRLLGAFEAIVRRGGLRGLGTTLISQRAAIVNKNVLEMIDVLIALRTVGPNDRDAVLGYVSAHGSAEEVKLFKSSLASLEIGEAWVWEPGAEPALFERVKIRERRTFNSSATPKPGEKRAEPKRLADVDLAALQKRMAATIEKAKADDPKALRARIAELERQAKTAPAGKPAKPTPAAPPGPRREDLATIRALRKGLEQAMKIIVQINAEDFAKLEGIDAAEVQKAIDVATGRVTELLERKMAERSRGVERLKREAASALAGLKALLDADVAVDVTVSRVAPTPASFAAKEARPTVSRPNGTSQNGGEKLAPCERGILMALAQHGAMSLVQCAIVARYSSSSGGVRNSAGSLRARGFVSGSNERLTITAAGGAALGPFDQLPMGSELAEHWYQLLSPCEGAILKAALGAYPGSVDLSAAAVAGG
jgi:hypothetical protein